MEPATLLARLRRQHGVSETFARRFLPLVERASKASPEVRERILELIERSFVRQASRAARKAPAQDPAAKKVDRAVLERVAKILHRWEPAPWIQRWGTE